jgi:hypothetical protein
MKKQQYENPKLETLSVEEILKQLGPAVALYIIHD